MDAIEVFVAQTAFFADAFCGIADAVIGGEFATALKLFNALEFALEGAMHEAAHADVVFERVLFEALVEVIGYVVDE